MDLNDPVLEPVTFDDETQHLEGSSSIAADPGLGIEEEDGVQSDGSGSDGDYDIEDMDY